MSATRREALALAVVVAARPASALAASTTEVTPLIALVAYQQEVVFGYDVTLLRAPLERGDRPTLTGFRHDAAVAAAALRAALKKVGGTPPPAPDPKTAQTPADPCRNGYLHEVILAEESAVARYYLALAQLMDKRHLRGSAAFMAQTGRRLVVLRNMVGAPLLPRAFETGGA